MRMYLYHWQSFRKCYQGYRYAILIASYEGWGIRLLLIDSHPLATVSFSPSCLTSLSRVNEYILAYTSIDCSATYVNE